MENIIISSKSQYLDKVLSDIDFVDKIVLDAGTGTWSARFLAQKKPKEIICVCGPGDMRKGEEAKNALQSVGYEKYQIVLKNLVHGNLFPSNTFDFILADYLIKEIDGFAPLGIFEVLLNLYNYLREDGELLILNPEAYVSFRPEYEITSTGVQGDNQLPKRDNRDLIDALYLFLYIPITLKLLFNPLGGSYPSRWIYNWLANVGFVEIETFFFDIRVNTDKEFSQRYTTAKQIISAICMPKLRDGLLEKLEEIVLEYSNRNVIEDDSFLRRHYIIRAKK